MISRSAAVVTTTHYKGRSVLCFELLGLGWLAVLNIEEKGLQGTRELLLSRFLASPPFKVSIAKLQPINAGVWYVPS